MDGAEYITLKEAAELSGYSPDYIGQLIRRGKLPGKQVYVNIAWVTPRSAVVDYLSQKGKKELPVETAYEPVPDQDQFLETKEELPTQRSIIDRAIDWTERHEFFVRRFVMGIIVILVVLLVGLCSLFASILVDRSHVDHSARITVSRSTLPS